ncbi:hypothetical protein Bpfe_026484 [Biomphalaria pfeifferi]|uniref:Uncharacterized protein n=1 Tax=Biomphalaria pfeifferi TaxID=112525 RepID=A0AAD8AX25_BIOPF|nr:hypothetical protein Bpfe_026484 [Biomphalaria pfeifferi]
MEPVGCNETTMRRFTNLSKMSCAVTCVNFLSCAAFIYLSETKTCSLCDSDLIENITFATDKVYSWPYRYRETVSNVNISGGISIGSMVQLSGYMYGPVTGFFNIRLSPYSMSPAYPLCVHVSNSQVTIHDSQTAVRTVPLIQDTIKVHLSYYPVIIWSPFSLFSMILLENKTAAFTLRLVVYQDHLFIRTSYIYIVILLTTTLVTT